MLGAGQHAVRRGRILALEPAHTGGGAARTQIAVLTGALGDPSPAGIARDVHHRREGHIETVGGGAVRRGARRALHKVGIKRAGKRQRRRQRNRIAGNDIRHEEQRHLAVTHMLLLDGAQILDRRVAVADERADMIDILCGEFPAGGLTGDHAVLSEIAARKLQKLSQPVRLGKAVIKGFQLFFR